jgi:hypothetical protein
MNSKRSSVVYKAGKEAGEGSNGRRADERESSPGARGSFFLGGGGGVLSEHNFVRKKPHLSKHRDDSGTKTLEW